MLSPQEKSPFTPTLRALCDGASSAASSLPRHTHTQTAPALHTCTTHAVHELDGARARKKCGIRAYSRARAQFIVSDCARNNTII